MMIKTNYNSLFYLWAPCYCYGDNRCARKPDKHNQRKVKRKDAASEFNDQKRDGDLYKDSREFMCYTSAGRRKADKSICRTLGKV